jgi:hypothetical protein
MLRHVRLPLAAISLAALLILAAAPAWQLPRSADVFAGARQNRQAFHDAMRKL